MMLEATTCASCRPGRRTNVIAEGEVLQLMNMHDPVARRSGLPARHPLKTAKLFEASARLGAVLAGSRAESSRPARLRSGLGTAFQVIDDVLDYDGDAEEMGKNLGDDLREGKGHCR
jgi:octaprenyl-diphosphate synthase